MTMPTLKTGVVTVGEFIVKRWSFSDDKATARYEAWEATSGPAGEHSSITTMEDDSARGYSWYGRVTTRGLDGVGYDALPSGPERSAAWDAYYASRVALAHAVIRMAFPDHRGEEREGEVIERGANLPPLTRRIFVVEKSPESSGE